MLNLNVVHLVGRSVADAETKDIGKDSKVATFRLVHNRRIKRRDGEYDEKATYVDCEVWGQRADYAGQYVKKGTPVLVRGQLETDEWTTKEGQKRSKLKIYCDQIQAERPRTPVGVGSASESTEAGGTDLPF
jgi:single-strand DNA-binding protein